jgi:hypothetical protein
MVDNAFPIRNGTRLQPWTWCYGNNKDFGLGYRTLPSLFPIPVIEDLITDIAGCMVTANILTVI